LVPCEASPSKTRRESPIRSMSASSDAVSMSSIRSAASRTRLASPAEPRGMFGALVSSPLPPQACSPMRGTKRTSISGSSRNSVSFTRVTRVRTCDDSSSPTGITRRPPIASCDRRAGGTMGPPAATAMASQGPCPGPPGRTAAPAPLHVGDPGLREPGLRALGQRRNALDRPDGLRETPQDGGGIAGERPHLENALSPFQGERLRGGGADVWLRDRLPFGDRRRGVFVGELRELVGEER